MCPSVHDTVQQASEDLHSYERLDRVGPLLERALMLLLSDTGGRKIEQFCRDSVCKTYPSYVTMSSVIPNQIDPRLQGAEIHLIL
jgi:hypothetical protein